MPRLVTTFLFALTATVAVAATAARCDDPLNLAVGAPNNWDSGVPDIGRRAGIFQKHGLNLELLYTSGGGETVQAVISRSGDLRIGARTRGGPRGVAQGAPRRLLPPRPTPRDA